MSAALAPGFADPVFDAQAVFRSVLQALSRPAIPQPLGAALDPPRPLTPELAAVALALADPDAPLWLDEPLAAEPAVAAYLRFHTGARIVSAPEDAAFALVAVPDDLLPFERFAVGTAEYPDRSTTIVIAADDLSTGPAIRLTGPGIRDGVTCRPSLPADFGDRLRANHALFPRGLDCLVVAPNAVLGIPRSSALVEAA